MSVAQQLREHGYRLTPQRRVVCDTLDAAQGHLTAEELHERSSAVVADLSLASVYRTLTLLDQLALARQVRFADGRAHWEPAHDHDEFHLVCRSCEAVTHHPADLVTTVRDHLLHDHGFDSQRVELVVTGLCADCRNDSPRTSRVLG